MQRSKSFAQAEAGCPLTPTFSYTHITLTDVYSLAKESFSSGVCALPSRLREGSHLQGEVTQVSHLSK